MAATKMRQIHQDEFRRKVQIGMILSKLHAHLNGEVELSETQIKAAKILLDKTISNAPTEINQTVEIKTDWTEADEQRLNYLSSKFSGTESRNNKTLQ